MINDGLRYWQLLFDYRVHYPTMYSVCKNIFLELFKQTVREFYIGIHKIHHYVDQETITQALKLLVCPHVL